jgi:hypothetical protein
MGKHPILKPREVAAILEKLGFVEARQRGSHKQYRSPGRPEHYGSFSQRSRHLTNPAAANR